MPDEPRRRWESTAPGSPGSAELVSQGYGQQTGQRQEQAMSELRDMEFEMIGRLETERVLREKQLQAMTQCTEKLDGHSSMLEKVLAQQRILNQTMQKLSAQQDQVVRSVQRDEAFSSPGQPATMPPLSATTPAAASAEAVEAPPAPVVEALQKMEVKMQEMQKSVEKVATSPVIAPTRSEEAEVVVEFGGLWYQNKAKHVISGKYLHSAAGTKSELEIDNQRAFSLRGDAQENARITQDGQQLVWSNGQIWTRAPGKRRPDTQAELLKLQQVAAKPSHNASQVDLGHVPTEKARVNWWKAETLPEELTEIRSIFGDSLRDHALMFDEASRIRGLMLRTAEFADWVEVQHRAPPRKDTRLERFVQSIRFEFVSAFLIMANAVYIGYTTNWFMQNPMEENPAMFAFIDVAFTVFFTIEIGLRACSLGQMFFFGPDAMWYLFDVLLIAVSVGELLSGSSGTFSFLRTLRVFKLARVIRMVRTLRLFGELRLLLDCMLGSLNSLFWCLLVIAFVFYLFALILVQGLTSVLGDIEREQMNSDTRRLLGGIVMARELTSSSSELQGEELGDYIKARWGSVSMAMLRLWEATTGGVDWEVEYSLVSKAGVFHSAVFIAFIAFMLIVVWNIVTSTILEKALRFAQPDIDQILMDKRRRDMEDVEVLLSMLGKIGIEASHKMTEDKFLTLLSQKDMVDFLQVRGIDIKEAHSFFDLINEDASAEGVDATSFIAMCLRIKGFATSIDLHTIHFQILGILNRQGKLLKDTITSVRELNTSVTRHHREESFGTDTSEVITAVLGGAGAASGNRSHP